MSIADPLEKDVAQALLAAGISFVHESEDNPQGLDFYLPDYGVYIECKAFYSERIMRQIADKRNVIVIQGYDSAKLFLRMLTKTAQSTPES